ncbi:transposase [Candidatus Fukatsuia symbiotica]|uniref:transposase n=2 Tax=Yersiniaceae TaxID=1903411 RepID=UPI001F07580F|nr:transposase [Candidatus Fukatsuia symbiotica]MEA9443941.1 transposase [Candidatus Fukatsuia symbiotica]
MTPSDPLACAIKDVASAQKTTFATTKAVWRFLNNARITFSQLNDPIIAFAREGIASSPHSYALVIHDGSGLQFQSHHKKQNRLQMSHGRDIGYELQSSLLVDAASGLPVAPLAQTLTDSAGCHSTLKDDTSAPQTHMDALTTDITRLEALDIGKTLVHIIDREGDSIAYMWELSVQGLRWLIRGKEGHRVQYKGETQKLGEVADGLEFTVRAEVDYKGRKAGLAISEAPVIITRVARPKRSDKETGRRIKAQPGHSLTVRLVVAQLSDNEGRVLGRWTLLTNVEDKLCGEERAQWYYWRWSIESFFKLIKGAGHNVEAWLQHSAVLRRLLIVSMACVLAWRLQRAEGEENARARQWICRLSGRQQKRSRRESTPSLLAGLAILLNTLKLLSEYPRRTDPAGSKSPVPVRRCVDTYVRGWDAFITFL